MRFRLQKLVFSAISFGLWLSFSTKAAENGAFSLKGYIPSLQNVSVRFPIIRPDGRYLFFSSASRTFEVLDLLDMAARSTAATSVAGNILDMGLINNRLTVVTTVGVQYFDVSDVFDIEEEDVDYELPNLSNLNLSVDSACVSPTGVVYFLERSTRRGFHQVRIIQNKSQSAVVPWSGLMGGSSNNYVPVFSGGLLCAKGHFVIFAEYFENTAPIDREFDLLISRIPYESPGQTAQVIAIQDQLNPFISDLQNFSDFEEFNLTETSLASDQETLVFVYNVVTPDISIDNSGNAFAHFISTAGLNSSSIVALGKGLKSVASFKRGEADFYSFFLENHFFESADLEGTNELLTISKENLSENPTGAQFGLPGYSVFPPPEISTEVLDLGIGNQSFAKWLSSAADHYVFGRTGSTGLVLLSNAPALYFREPPGTPTLKGNEPLRFDLVSDEEINYEIRVIESEVLEGEASGLNLSKGKKVKEGQIAENSSVSVELSVSDLDLQFNGFPSLLILGRVKDQSVDRSVARTGLRFNYNPPPDPIEDFQLKFGSQSIHVIFDLGSDPGDVEEFHIHFSFDRSDLENLPNSDDELASFSRNVPLANGESLSSPIIVKKESFKGRSVLAPIENERELFVRVQVVDDSRQYSLNNPEAIGQRARATRRLESLLGSTGSGCSLGLAHQ